MANPFGGFVHTSPLSSPPHDPAITLASNCIRDYFGPTVQTVADCLLARGESTLSQITAQIRSHCLRVLNEERDRLVASLCTAVTTNTSSSSSSSSATKTFKSDKNNIAKLGINRARGPETAGYVVDPAPIRAALIVLLQHSIVKAVRVVSPSSSSAAADNNTVAGKTKRSKQSAESESNIIPYKYTLDPERARLLPRCSRYVEYVKRTMDDNAAAIVEEVLVHGRMLTEDIVQYAKDNAERYCMAASATNDDDDDDGDGDEVKSKEKTEEASNEEKKASSNEGGGRRRRRRRVGSSTSFDEAERAELRDGVIRSLRQLVEGGFLEMVPPLDGGDDEHEMEFGDDAAHAGGKRKRIDAMDGRTGTEKKIKTEDGESRSHDDNDMYNENDGGESSDRLIVKLLRSNNTYRRLFPPGVVWRINATAFHHSIRALALGRLAHERYGDKVRSGGSIVSAALKLAVRKEHGRRPDLHALSEEERQRRLEDKGVFVPDEVMEYLPPAIAHAFKNRAGGARSNLSASLVALAEFNWPSIVMEIEEATGHPLGGKFEIATRQLVEHLRGRILHQVVLDSHGEVAARICAVLEAKGHLESDAVAEAAMVPAKDVREVLHRLYRANYIGLMNLQQSKQHNPSNAIYLWYVEKSRMYRTVTDNVCKALVNLRLRRQHEMEVGREWIERAKEAGATDENENELDKVNYNKFCQGLERLDNALLQLDETLLALKDF